MDDDTPEMSGPEPELTELEGVQKAAADAAMAAAGFATAAETDAANAADAVMGLARFQIRSTDALAVVCQGACR